MRYFNSLNTLRAVAVMLVIFEHWLPGNSQLYLLHTGPFGVDIFFTLSGFLITAILLKDIKASQANNRPTRTLLGHFFARRVLRILPPYVLALVLTILLRPLLYKFDFDVLPYLVSFTFNIYIFNQAYWPPNISHFWTLAVEEQYYLFWPFFMVITSSKGKPLLMACMIVIAIIVRYILRSHVMFDIPTLACLDAFGLGSLLAWLYLNLPATFSRLSQQIIWLSIVLLIIIIVLNFSSWYGYVFLRRFLQSFISCALIAYLVNNADKPNMWFRWFWENPALVFIGKISYGMYLYHFLVPHIPFFPWYISNLIMFLLLITISWASFTFVEMPILSLKKYFK